MNDDWSPLGIELASDRLVREKIRKEAWQRQRWVRPPVVVEPGGFMTQIEASERLRSTAAPLPHINLLVARGILQQAFRSSDGADGVTTTSVEAELTWRTTASAWKKLTRRIGSILHWV